MESYEADSLGRREADERRQRQHQGEAANAALGSDWRSTLTEELREDSIGNPKRLPAT